MFRFNPIKNVFDTIRSNAELDARYVNLSGDTMTGLLTLSGAPTSNLHAATKKYVDDSVGAENLWDRTDTTLSPHTAGDDVQTTGTGTFGNITIFNPTPILVFKDSTYVGDVSLGYIEWRDSNNTRLGFFGNSSSGNDDLYWKNESSGGHIKIETTGGGEVQILANVDLGSNDLTTTGNIIIDSDSSLLKLGDGQDVTIGFDGTNMTIDPNTSLAGGSTVAGNFLLIEGGLQVRRGGIKFYWGGGPDTDTIYKDSTNALKLNSRWMVGAGTLGALPYTFINDSNTGFFNPGEDRLQFVTEGIYGLEINADQNVLVPNNLIGSGTGAFGTLTLGSGSITDSSGAISFGNENLSTTGSMSVLRYYNWTGDADTYINLESTDNIGIYAGGYNAIDIDMPNNAVTLNNVTLNVAALSTLGKVRANDKIYFTQADENEYIDSLADGYMDYGATTAHRFNAPIRGTTSLWWRIHHIDLASTPALGATGAVYTPQSANNLNGYQLDNDPSEEYIYFNTHVGTDWDAASDLEVVVQFETNVDNSGGAGTDTVNFDLVMYYKGDGETAQKTQDLDAFVIVGTAAQYYHEEVMFTIDYDLAANVVEVGDCISFALHLNTTDSEVDNVIVHHAMFRYRTNKVRAEV